MRSKKYAGIKTRLPWFKKVRVRAVKRRLYYVLGQTELGRYLFIVLRAAQIGTAYVITAREMTDTERRLYERRRSHG